MKKIFYHDIDLYHYFIGRADQSINYKTMCQRYEQQMRVFKIMFTAYTYDEIYKQPYHLRKYMIKWLMTICGITYMTIVGVKDDKETRWKTFKQYFKELKEIDRKLYNKIRHRSLAAFAFAVPGYNLKSFASRKVYGAYQKKLKLG